MAEFDPGSGGLLGTNDLQQSVDTFKSAVDELKSIVTNQATSSGPGLTTHPAMGSMAEGQTFTKGSMNAIAAGGNGAWGPPGLTASQQRGGVLLGGGGGSGGSPPTMGQTASGGGANGGGATFGTPTGSAIGHGYGPNGNQQYPSPAGPPPPPGKFSGAGQRAAGGAISAGSAVIQSGMGQYNGQLLYNAYGQQMAAQWGGGAQGYQNTAFGNTDGSVNAAAAGNAQSAAAEMGTLTQMAGGANVTGTAAFGATNAFAFANQGMGAAGASQLASQVYNPSSSLRMQLLTGVSAINPASGKQNPLSSVITGLAGEGYLGGGGYNARTGTFKQSALNASFTAGRGTSWMNLQSLGYSQSQIQDIQSTMTEANSAAVKGHTSLSNVMSTMNKAEYGGTGQISSADSQLQKWGVNLSTIQKQGNQSSINMAQSQSQSSTYNESVSAFTSAMTKATQAVNWFLDHTGLNKAIGGVQGAGAGYSSSGAGGWVSGVKSVIGDVINPMNAIKGVMGGGAASVSTAQPQTSQGSRSGNSMSSVSGQVTTAVKDAEQQVGKPYVYGGDTPQTSFDCSGLVMWAYDQAGVHLPRTSEQQWASLKNKSVSLDQVQEGDIVFQAGSDGTASSPGHEALMISSKQIVEAPYTGANIRIRAYNPGEWQHAGRPVGKGGAATGGSAVSSTASSGTAGSSLGAGNAGSAMSGGNGGDATLGLTTDADSMLFSGGGGGTGMGGGSGPATLTGGTSNGSGASGSGANNVSTAGGGSAAANKKLAQKMAQQMYGWSGSQWTDGLDPLWTQESGFKSDAQNPNSTAFGIAQFLNSTWGPYGKKTTDPGLQIKYGLEYIHHDYKTPLQAEAHEKQYNWYGAGTGSAMPGVALVGDRGPELISLSGGQQIHNAKDTSDLLRGNSALPAQAPWTASPAQQLLLDTLTPANSHAMGAGGGVCVNLTVEKGAIHVTGSGGAGGGSSDIHTMTSAFTQVVEKSLQKSELLQNIARGNTGS